MTKDERNAGRIAEIADPVPREHAFDSDHKIASIWPDDIFKCRWFGFYVLMDHDPAFRIQDANIHASCMKIYATIKFMVFCIKLHPASSCFSVRSVLKNLNKPLSGNSAIEKAN